MPKHIGIIAAPKTASTFLWQVLRRSGNFNNAAVLQAVEGRAALPHADQKAAQTIARSRKPQIFREHLAPSRNSLTFVDRSGVVPIVMTRDIFDIAVSLKSEWERQWTDGHRGIEAEGYHLQFIGAVPWPFVSRFLEADEGQQYDMVINVAVPWLCSFESGWKLFASRRPGFFHVIDYATLAKDPAGAITSLARDAQLPLGNLAQAIDEVLSDRVVANFNIGEIGRGRRILSEAQVRRIAATMRDFGLIRTGCASPTMVPA